MSDAAPLLTIDGWAPPPGGAAFFLTPPAGAARSTPTVRGAFWRGRGRGLVVVLPGRSEFIEKFYGVVGRFLDLGYDVGAIDWRGQGLSSRPLSDPRKGHVTDFAEYQLDLDTFLRRLVEEGAPSAGSRPWLLFGHSMGGAIAARALMRRAGLGADLRYVEAGAPPGRFASAILSAPMLRLAGSAMWRIGARGLSATSLALGRSERYAAGMGPRTIAELGFEGNVLTSDRRQFEIYANLLGAHPQLAVAGATWRWVSAALREMRALRPTAAPTLAMLGSEDTVISNAAARAFVASGQKGRAVELQGARHEPYLETQAHRETLWRNIAGFLDEIGL